MLWVKSYRLFFGVVQKIGDFFLHCATFVCAQSGQQNGGPRDMSSFTGAVLRLIFKRKPREGRIDEEHAVQNGIPTVNPASTAMTSTIRSDTNVVGHRSYRVAEDDPLMLFRLMVGISTSPYLGYSESSPIGTRPAANIGIYARVIHAEQKAKDSYKVYSILINACYFLQIVVAASLTAMGAAGVSHGAVTAFGAINTIIAGLLTFLKGSGLPGRFKYYSIEWKKIREFIEQRERDFSRARCTLDVYEVVAAIDRMWYVLKISYILIFSLLPLQSPR